VIGNLGIGVEKQTGERIEILLEARPKAERMHRILRQLSPSSKVGLAAASLSVMTARLSPSSSRCEFNPDTMLSDQDYDSYGSNSSSAQSSSGADHIFSRYTIADVAGKVSPSVVNIMHRDANRMSSGSGFLITKSGYIVTNEHVVRAAGVDGKVTITFTDMTKASGTVHSLDRSSDIALVKISDAAVPPEATPLKLGKSSKLRAGEFVIALGSPVNLANSVSHGIVSAVARHGSDFGLAKSRSDYIQTDTPINQGNSGGPLCNLDGEVIGINAMKLSNTDGISFAIPIDTAVQVLRQLMRNKKVTRPYVGLRMTSTSGHHGGELVITDVEKGSPAEQVGLESGFRIIEVNGKKATLHGIFEAVGLEPGRSFDLKVKKPSGEEMKVSLVSVPGKIW
jgi:HtrA serine peptidase 2